jgi:hypothetical protein
MIAIKRYVKASISTVTLGKFFYAQNLIELGWKPPFSVLFGILAYKLRRDDDVKK